MTNPSGAAEAEMGVYRGIQQELASLGGRRQQFIAQINENGMVKQELELLDEEAQVFKMVGPILVKQDLADAKSNVEKRLEFINNELEKLQGMYQEKEKLQEASRDKIMKIQQSMQEKAAAAAQEAAADAAGQ